MSQIEILVGSTLGGTEYVAEAAQTLLEEAFFDTDLHLEPDLNEMSLQEEQIWLVCLATHGAGDYPENFKDFVDQLQQVNAPLDGVRYAIVGIGDSNYDTFCEAAKNLDYILEEMGAQRIGDRLEIDVVVHPMPEDRIADWIPLLIEDLNELID
ncbi:FMN-binding protein MioC [Psychromonas sp. Urea-02u-13]|uniref:FMN-binding protein MioC n=1 Tax=Psychromonas sp. Urea-02u-13 TaxID=2058326 RepID=UPI000C337857|nr:FMN-binding protein MioC [Psychromonas sp. Urea-02u-13]PKG40186.1 FMN-binding protein MioC [Psychromonas sp. Urea-02u-13]